MSFVSHKSAVTGDCMATIPMRDVPPGSFAIAYFNGREELVLVPSEHMVHADDLKRKAIQINDGDTVIGMDGNTPCRVLPDGVKITITVKNSGRTFALRDHSCHEPQPTFAKS